MKVNESSPAIQKLNVPEGKKTQKNPAENDRKLRKASKELEGMFLSILFKAMEKTIPRDPQEGAKMNLARMMFSTVMGEAIAEKGGIGLAKFFYETLQDAEQISRLDEMNLPDLEKWDVLMKLKTLENGDE